MLPDPNVPLPWESDPSGKEKTSYSAIGAWAEAHPLFQQTLHHSSLASLSEPSQITFLCVKSGSLVPQRLSFCNSGTPRAFAPQGF